MPTANELTDAYQSLSTALMDSAGSAARDLFNNLGNWRDADRDRFISLMNQVVTPAKREAAKLAVAYYQQMAAIEGQRFRPPVISPADYTTEALRGGAQMDQVYSRPFVDLYTALSAGKNMTDAVKAGAIRASDLARTEVQLARRGAGLVARGRNKNIVGYLRVLSGSENCALCYVASTQRYHKGDLMPIHPGCDCGETPIYGTTDVGQVIDRNKLDSTHEAVYQRFGTADAGARKIDYSKITVQEHGELGPVLTVDGQHFTGPNDLPPNRTWGR